LVFSAIIFPVQKPDRAALAARKLRIAKEEMSEMLYLHQNNHHHVLSTIVLAPYPGAACAELVREGAGHGL